MQGLGVLALIGGYCAWYTLFQRMEGDNTGFLYNLTGSRRFLAAGVTPSSLPASEAQAQAEVNSVFGSGTGGPTASGPNRPPSGQPPPRS